MKKVRIVLSVVFVLTLIGSWGITVKNNVTAKQNYKQNISNGDKWTKNKLYDRAIDEYEEALNYKDTNEVWEKLLNAYKKRCEDQDVYGYSAVEEYVEKLKEAVKKDKKNEKRIIELAQIYIKEEAYESAYKCLNNAYKNGAKSKKIEELITKVKYAYDLQSNGYDSFYQCDNGKYVVKSQNLWGIINKDGQTTTDLKYQYISIIGEKNMRVKTINDESRLYNSDGKVLGIFDFAVMDAGKYSEGLIPIKKDEKYAYYDSTGKMKFGEYDIAGTFKDGTAAVREGEKWKIIDEYGKVKKAPDWEEVKLNSQGYYIYDDIIVAKTNEKYEMYNSKFKKIGNFKCDEFGNITDDGVFAFKQDDKWGFVNTEGKVVIKPEYDDARSFSNGLAAVCKNGKWGFITGKNKLVIDYTFDDADYFNENGVCFVKDNNPYDELGYSWVILKLKI